MCRQRARCCSLDGHQTPGCSRLSGRRRPSASGWEAWWPSRCPGRTAPRCVAWYICGWVRDDCLPKRQPRCWSAVCAPWSVTRPPTGGNKIAPAWWTAVASLARTGSQGQRTAYRVAAHGAVLISQWVLNLLHDEPPGQDRQPWSPPGSLSCGQAQGATGWIARQPNHRPSPGAFGVECSGSHRGAPQGASGSGKGTPGGLLGRR